MCGGIWSWNNVNVWMSLINSMQPIALKCLHLLATTSVWLVTACQNSVSSVSQHTRHCPHRTSYLLRFSIFLMALFQFFANTTSNNQFKFCCKTTTFICVLQWSYLNHWMCYHCNKYIYISFQTQYGYCDKVDKVSADCISATCSTSLSM